MGCCGTVVKDIEIEQAVNMTELISIMNKKKKMLRKEIDEINFRLKDKNYEVTVAKVDALSDEDLQKRIPYLEELENVYGQVIDNMKLLSTKVISSIYYYSFHSKKQKNIYTILYFII